MNICCSLLRRVAILALAVLAGSSLACATNPATGKRQFTLVSEQQEIAIGQQSHQQILAAYGAYPDEKLQAYVNELGQTIARSSERPELPWTFTVLDDTAVNAFALPGGFIYVTRGILAHMASEAELVSVLGHEVGHVTARHGADRMTKAQLGQIGLIAGMIASEEFAQYGQVAQMGLGLLLLKNGRDDERQADDLGFRYLTMGGYDPKPMTEMFDVLRRVSEGSSGGRLPNWLSTHPDPSDRIQRIQMSIDGMVVPAGTKVEREAYLDRLDGLVFGADPREGYFIGNRFYQPELAFQLDFPKDWKTSNQKAAVGAVSPNEDAAVVLALASGASAQEAAQTFFAQDGIQTIESWRDPIGGLPTVGASFSAGPSQGQQSQQGQQAQQSQQQAQQNQPTYKGVAAFVEDGSRIYRLLAYTGDKSWGAYGGTFNSALRSYRKITDPKYLDVTPGEVRLVRIDRAMTLEEFHRRYPSDVDLRTLSILNHVPEKGMLEAGKRYKQVVAGKVPKD